MPGSDVKAMMVEGSTTTTSSHKFQAIDRTSTTPDVQLPDEIWMTILETPCSFSPDIFEQVMLNLIKNPNVTSSHLFRADIFYDSGENGSHDGRPGSNDLARHLKAHYRPIMSYLPGYDLRRTIVRQLIPRNPQLDEALIQTCHFFQRWEGDEEVGVVLYIPHLHTPEDIPFYHPAVSKVAFLHRWNHGSTARPSHDPSRSPESPSLGTLTLSYALFPGTLLTPKLQRTALRLLQTVHKHGQGQLAGYEKRVHLDQIIPQKRYQDTYTRLKTKYGRLLAEQWVEVTDPGKHVFEDIGIAAFLVELWRDVYTFDCDKMKDKSAVEGDEEAEGECEKPRFPGFVDVGCGNGLLVFILLSEGYKGWGFDARERKTWSIFPEHIQQQLKQRLLVPQVLLEQHNRDNGESAHVDMPESRHNGILPPGTFIISNHADELTAWTPLLAYLNKSSFIAIPCCSHDLSGARFRAPLVTKAQAKDRDKNGLKTTAMNSPNSNTRLPQQEGRQLENAGTKVTKGAAETGSLVRTPAQKKIPSAYSSLCAYIGGLAEEVGFQPETEVLRIPSTRNLCIVGRYRDTVMTSHDGSNADTNGDSSDMPERKKKVVELVGRELGRQTDVVSREWIKRAEGLAKKPGSGH